MAQKSFYTELHDTVTIDDRRGPILTLTVEGPDGCRAYASLGADDARDIARALNAFAEVHS